MPDPCISKLAKVLVHYSVEVQKGQQVLMRTTRLQMNSLSPCMKRS